MAASGVCVWSPQSIIPQDQWTKCFPDRPLPHTVASIKYHLSRSPLDEHKGGWTKMIQQIVRDLWKHVKGADDCQISERDTLSNCERNVLKHQHICPASHTAPGCIQYHSKHPESPLGKSLSTLAYLLSDERLNEACAAYNAGNVGRSRSCQGACQKSGQQRGFANCIGAKKIYFEEVMPRRAGLLFTYIQENVHASKSEMKEMLINLALDLVHVYWAVLASRQRSLHGSSQ